MSPSEAQLCGGDISSQAAQLASRIAQGLSSGLEAFVLDKREDDYDLFIKIVNLSGVRGVLLVKDMGPYVVLYIDRSAIERRCLYEACSGLQTVGERRTCAKRCVSERLPSVIGQVSQSICEVAKSLGPSRSGPPVEG
ncbi:MAG: hypothetical protein ACP5HK_00435 [Acidilobus sp.]